MFTTHLGAGYAATDYGRPRSLLFDLNFIHYWVDTPIDGCHSLNFPPDLLGGSCLERLAGGHVVS